jgi:hypothetical protein
MNMKTSIPLGSRGRVFSDMVQAVRNSVIILFVATTVLWWIQPEVTLADEPGDDEFAEPRSLMLEKQLADRGISDERVLKAMGEVPRHELVPEKLRPLAYTDRPLPSGHDQTISQP